jgi:hypothetical protein
MLRIRRVILTSADDDDVVRVIHDMSWILVTSMADRCLSLLTEKAVAYGLVRMSIDVEQAPRLHA